MLGNKSETMSMQSFLCTNLNITLEQFYHNEHYTTGIGIRISIKCYPLAGNQHLSSIIIFFFELCKGT